MTQATYEMFAQQWDLWKKWCFILKGAGNFTFMKILVVEIFELTQDKEVSFL